MSYFPTSVATSAELLTPSNNTKVILDGAVGVGDTSIQVDDASSLPNSGYLTFDDDNETPETIFYTNKSSNILTGVTRGADGTSAVAHAGTAGLEQRWNAAYYNLIKAEVIAIEQNISDRFGLGTDIVIQNTVSFALEDTTDGNTYRILIQNGELSTQQIN